MPPGQLPLQLSVIMVVKGNFTSMYGRLQPCNIFTEASNDPSVSAPGLRHGDRKRFLRSPEGRCDVPNREGREAVFWYTHPIFPSINNH
jgi:hypothetical protein